ncbi:ATP-binding protein [Polycyclovorans algicola]|uniref:ATP-binding protein n=1 Tax=Polycyclovorans algicola TaxID=616992 RepID=UPI000693A6B3|nr:ATP-binding protein [Polycyclovorans algicola]
MRLVEVKLANFRGYAQETTMPIDPLTVLIGRNDAGKSSVLDALDIFFNEATIEKEDCCVGTTATEIRIACVFEDLPAQLVIDDQHPTTLQAEHLVRSDGRLEIIKVYNCAAAKGKLGSVMAKALHPSTQGTDDLLGLKITELRSRAQQRQVDLSQTNQTIKTQLRSAIWGQADDLERVEREVGLSKETGKEVWEQLQTHMPVYALFKSDRASTDQDAEAQDPLKSAIKEAIRRRETELNDVIGDIRRELERVAGRTVEKIREMNHELANQLHPAVKNKNWDSLFTVTLTGENDIPINKRGSGTRRLVLLNFFRAKAEDDSLTKGGGVIYAIEEPETSQHPNYQIMLLEAFEDLVDQGRCQVLLTTHTPTLARRVNRNSLRLITSVNGAPVVQHGNLDQTLERIRDTLGVLPDHDVKAFFGVEGKHDIQFLRRISAMLAATEPDIPNLEAAEQAGKLVFLSLGGSSMELWISTVAGFGRPEFYLTDRDQAPPAQPKYQQHIAQWVARGCTAWATSKGELENYLHPSAILAESPGYSGTGADFEDVPMLFAEAVHSGDRNAPAWATVSPEKRKDKASAGKKRLNTACVSRMTPALLMQSDPNDDIRTWLRAVGRALDQ